jgi:hypothetical protein
MQKRPAARPSLADRMNRIALINSLHAGQHEGIPNPIQVAREIARLVQEMDALRSENAALLTENAALQAENAALRIAIGTTPTAA